jgi:hypothetical protein
MGSAHRNDADGHSSSARSLVDTDSDRKGGFLCFSGLNCLPSRAVFVTLPGMNVFANNLLTLGLLSLLRQGCLASR